MPFLHCPRLQGPLALGSVRQGAHYLGRYQTADFAAYLTSGSTQNSCLALPHQENAPPQLRAGAIAASERGSSQVTERRDCSARIDEHTFS